jgi:hypothetical protein
MRIMRLKTPQILDVYWRNQALFSDAYTNLLGTVE